MENSQPYPYKPLTEPDSIRLLCLSPVSTGTDVLEVSLVHTTFSKCDVDIIDSYTALSYVWGDATKLKMIHVDSVPVTVTSNLHDALYDIRDDTRVLRLWVDALCINQIDNEEKAIQVNMMSKIYMNALHTIIYLGPGIPVHTQTLPQDIIPWYTLSAMFHSQWFRRVWVFQEFVLSKDPWLQFGSTRWRWGVVKRNIDPQNISATPQLRHVAPLVGSSSALMREMDVARKDYRGKTPQKQTLLRLLQLRRGLGATDPRDMVFAQISIAYDKYTIRTDYTRECFEIYNDFATNQILKDGTYKLLLNVGDTKSPNQMPGLASWAPDWRHFQPLDVAQLKHLFRLELSFRNPRIPFGGEGLLFGAFTIVRKPMLLACVGRRKEYIKKIRQPLTYYHSEGSLDKDFRSTLERLILQEREQVSTNHRALEEFKELYVNIIKTWRETLDLDIPNLSEIWQSNHLRYLFGFLKEVYSSPNPLTIPHIRRMLVSDAIVASYLGPFCDLLKDRKLAQMSNYSIALVPKDANYGDFILYSCSQEELSQEREPFLLHTRQELSTPVADAAIKLQFDQRLNPLLRKASMVEFPSVEHCTFIGLTYMDHTRLDETAYGEKGSHLDPLKDASRRLLSASSSLKTTLSEPKFGPVTIFAIH